MANKDVQQLTVQLPQDLYTRLQQTCAEQEISLNDVLIRLVEQYLQKPATATPGVQKDSEAAESLLCPNCGAVGTVTYTIKNAEIFFVCQACAWTFRVEPSTTLTDEVFTVHTPLHAF